MKDQVKRFLTLRGEKQELEVLLKSISDEMNSLQTEMIAEMDSSGISQLVSETGEKLSLVKTRYTQVTDFVMFQNWCEENGSQELLKLTFDRKLTNDLCFGLDESSQPLPDGVEVGINQSLRVYKGKGNGKTLLEVLE